MLRGGAVSRVLVCAGRSRAPPRACAPGRRRTRRAAGTRRTCSSTTTRPCGGRGGRTARGATRAATRCGARHRLRAACVCGAHRTSHSPARTSHPPTHPPARMHAQTLRNSYCTGKAGEVAQAEVAAQMVANMQAKAREAEAEAQRCGDGAGGEGCSGREGGRAGAGVSVVGGKPRRRRGLGASMWGGTLQCTHAHAGNVRRSHALPGPATAQAAGGERAAGHRAARGRVGHGDSGRGAGRGKGAAGRAGGAGQVAPCGAAPCGAAPWCTVGALALGAAHAGVLARARGHTPTRTRTCAPQVKAALAKMEREEAAAAAEGHAGDKRKYNSLNLGEVGAAAAAAACCAAAVCCAAAAAAGAWLAGLGETRGLGQRPGSSRGCAPCH